MKYTTISVTYETRDKINQRAREQSSHLGKRQSANDIVEYLLNEVQKV